jgi:hypothetical protein
MELHAVRNFKNDDGTLNIANNVATTIYTPSGARGLYLLYLSLPAGDSAPANYSAYAIFSWDTASAIILQQTDAANLFITLNGNNIQARQVSGAANDVTWRVIKNRIKNKIKMGYSIQPVQIWTNGTAATGNYIDASIVNDNLKRLCAVLLAD